MHIQGTITEFLPETSGTSKAGNEWFRGGVVIETLGDYPKKVAFTAFNERLSDVQTFEVGQIVKIDFRAESRKWDDRNGVARWSTELSIISIEPLYKDNAAAPSSVNPQQGLPF